MINVTSLAVGGFVGILHIGFVRCVGILIGFLLTGRFDIRFGTLYGFLGRQLSLVIGFTVGVDGIIGRFVGILILRSVLGVLFGDAQLHP